MPKTVTLTIQIDPELKEQTERLLYEMGLTPSQAITLFFRQIVSQRAIPFAISLPNEETLQAMQDVAQRRNLKSLDSLEL
jgi:DNA-damage-inducible protein J